MTDCGIHALKLLNMRVCITSLVLALAIFILKSVKMCWQSN